MLLENKASSKIARPRPEAAANGHRSRPAGCAGGEGQAHSDLMMGKVALLLHLKRT